MTPNVAEALDVADDPLEREAHGRALDVLQGAGLEPMVGGAYALRCHTTIWRDTKDLDLFLRKDRVEAALDALHQAGFRCELTDPMWLGKAFDGEYFIDLIFSSGNGVAVVDEHWTRRAGTAEVLGRQCLVIPPEEMIWSKAFVQERERYDGADIHHLLRCSGKKLDWEHVLMRFEPHWQVLLGHLITFRFAFPSDKDQVPAWVMHELIGRLQEAEEAPPGDQRLCRGTLLSRTQYLYELREGYLDARERESTDWHGGSFTPRPHPARRQ